MQQNLRRTSPASGPAKALRAKRPRGDIARAIGVRILDGTYAPGQVLPNEAEWGRTFTASRTAVREALKTLAGKGLLASRPKVGSTVEPRHRWNMLDRDVLAWHLATTPIEKFVTDLFVLRRMVEPQAARLAAEARNPAMVARISAAYERMERFRGGGHDLIAADLAFHLAILETTVNHFLTSLGNLIHTSLEFSFQYSWQGAAGMKDERLHKHRAVLAAIRAGKPQLAERHMTGLLDASLGDLHRYFKRQKKAAAKPAATANRKKSHVHSRS